MIASSRSTPSPFPFLLPRPAWILALLFVGAAACGNGENPSPESIPETPATEHGEAHETAPRELGAVDFPTSCSDAVQPRLETGLALLHHMMYVEAAEAFQEAARGEPECAMAHWGLAYAHFQPFWGEADLDAGRRHALEAAAMGAPTAREEAWIRSAVAFFEDEDAGYRTRLEQWASAVEALHREAPEDQEAAAFHALATLSLDPADAERQARAHALLEDILAEEPRHPGAIHYAIHVHDVDHRAEEGERFARAYEELAPSVPHALHMPSHIYVRLGAWEEVIEWNRRSADAALDHPAGDYVSFHHAHALDYLMYGYLQRGEDAAALEVLEELRAQGPYQHALGAAYALAAIPARWAVERRDWAAAAALETGTPADFPWERFPAAEALTHYARGLGAARSGDPDRAREDVQRLEALEATLADGGDVYWGRQVELQRRTVSAWIAHAEGRADEALERMTEAAEIAAGMQKHPITPGDPQPVRELLGDLLLEMDRPDAALDAYRASLETWPERYHSLVGAMRAARATGDGAAATAYAQALLALAADGDPNRDGLEEARALREAGSA